MSKAKIAAVLVTAGVAVLVVSSTLGRELYAGRTPSLTSFAIIHFAGYLFFLLMPVEALVPIYQAEDHGALVLIALALVTALAAQAIDYAIGRAVAESTLHRLIGEARYERFRAVIGRWGGSAIFLFNLFPLSSPNMMLVAGLTRYGAARAFLYSGLGLTAKYSLIVYVFETTSLWWAAG